MVRRQRAHSDVEHVHNASSVHTGVQPRAAPSAPLTSHLSPLAPRLSPLASRLSPLASRLSPLAPHPSPLTPRPSPLASIHSILRSSSPSLSMWWWLLPQAFASEPDAFQPTSIAVVGHFEVSDASPEATEWRDRHECFDWTYKDAQGKDAQAVEEMQRRHG